jgi:molybdopterin converting factor small subunit
MATINIPTPLRKFTGQHRDFETDKRTLSDAIDHLVATYPGVRNNLLDDQGQLRSFIKIYVGDSEVALRKDEPVTLNDDTEISIVPAIAGGCA